MDKDRVKGAARNVGGRIKQRAGKALGDSKLENEGRGERVAGKLQNVAGGVKDKARETRTKH
jgi:uncharacterized protein YjbJ (UPF0337 family)